MEIPHEPETYFDSLPESLSEKLMGLVVNCALALGRVAFHLWVAATPRYKVIMASSAPPESP